jgi:hypothetical protein
MKFKNLLPGYGATYDLGILGPITIIGLSVFLRTFANCLASAIFLPTLSYITTTLHGSGTQMQSIGGAV